MNQEEFHKRMLRFVSNIVHETPFSRRRGEIKLLLQTRHSSSEYSPLSGIGIEKHIILGLYIFIVEIRLGMDTLMEVKVFSTWAR